MPFHSLLG